MAVAFCSHCSAALPICSNPQSHSISLLNSTKYPKVLTKCESYKCDNQCSWEWCWEERGAPVTRSRIGPLMPKVLHNLDTAEGLRTIHGRRHLGRGHGRVPPRPEEPGKESKEREAVIDT